MFVGFIPLTTSPTHITFHNLNIKLQLNNGNKSIQKISKSPSLLSCRSSNSSKICLLCGRRPFLATLSTALIQINKSNASDSLPDDPMGSPSKTGLVGESLPVTDGSMDAVVGTLVLCSVEDVNKTLQEIKRVLKPGGLYIFVEHVAAKDGTFLKVIQRVLDPLQQTVADGCHLTRETGDSISAAGFSSVDIQTAFLSSASLINPHAYSIALK